METTPCTVGPAPEKRPLVIRIGTELEITVEDHDGIEIDSRGTDGPVIRITGGTGAVLRACF